MSLRKGYSNGPFGQLHWRLQDATARRAPDLYCFHPAPFSGVAYTSLMPHLATARRVFAPDYPGHGGSDAFRAQPAIEDYARAMLAVIADHSKGAPVDVMGFHTGCLVAAEVALQAPACVRRVALVDVPAFAPEVRAMQLAALTNPFEITPELACLASAWDMGMTRRLESQGLERGFEMFAEHIRHGRWMNAAFHAGFCYDVEDRLPRLLCPTLIIATQSGLLEATRRAATLIPAAQFVERLDIRRAVLDEASAETASELRHFLVPDQIAPG
jgi:pimeloyl-ACP methyl ester carboxylesterase